MNLQNQPLYPIRFVPIYKDYLWGGNRFRNFFHRSVPSELSTAAESWEICDLSHGMSIVQSGLLQGTTLHEIFVTRFQDLFGTNSTQNQPARFPLILKYLDAAQSLSVQVHPDDLLAQELSPNDAGKTEVWVIVDAAPDSSILIGTRQKWSREEQENLIRHGDWNMLLNRVPVQKGDCFFVPPGTLHALGENILVAEIQTTSDLTYRMFDWNRLDQNGKPRELKIEEGIRALQNPSVPVAAQIPQQNGNIGNERLIINPHFIIDRYTLTEPVFHCNNNCCHIWTIIEGTLDLCYLPEISATENFSVQIQNLSPAQNHLLLHEKLRQGDSILIPAICRQFQWIPPNDQSAVLLDITVCL